MVKCQNLKTQEVVAVKVVKNRTAYFNQSMMEVSVLDLVREDDCTESITRDRADGGNLRSTASSISMTIITYFG